MNDRWYALPLFFYGLWLVLRPDQHWWLVYGWAVERGSPTSFSIRLIRVTGYVVILMAACMAIFGLNDQGVGLR